MAEFPALPLFTDAYLSDTHPGLTLEQHGAYLLLMMLAWRRPGCTLPNDDRWIKGKLGVHGNKWNWLRATVLERFWRQREDGEWEQKRLAKERAYITEASERARASAAKRWVGNKIDRESNRNRSKINANSESTSGEKPTSGVNESKDLFDATAMPPHGNGNAPTPTPIKKDSLYGESLFPTENQSRAEAREGGVSREATIVNGADPKKTLFDLGTDVLGRGNGSLVGSLLKAKRGNVDLAISALTDAKTTLNPKGYIATVIRNAANQDDDEYLDPHKYMRL